MPSVRNENNGNVKVSATFAKDLPSLRCFGLNSSDSQGVRASASGAVDLGLIPSRDKPMTLKLTFTASLLDAQH